MSSSSFLVVSLGLSVCSMSSAHGGFTFSFPVWSPFISFSSLIAMARPFKTKLNKNSESGHPCLFPNLSRNVFSFSPLNMMLAVVLSYMVFISWDRFTLFPLLGGSLSKWMLNSIEGFFCTYFNKHMVFIFKFVNWWIILVDLHILKKSLDP